MAEQRDRTGERRGAEQAPRPHGWRVRAAQAYGDLSPEPSLTLSASEIGAYAFVRRRGSSNVAGCRSRPRRRPAAKPGARHTVRSGARPTSCGLLARSRRCSWSRSAFYSSFR